MSAELVQVLSTCPSCRVEAALVELVELTEAGSTVFEGRCRMCGRWERQGSLVDPGIPFREAVQVEAALARWAEREGEDDLDAFLASGFGGLDRPALIEALLAGRPVETTFDVIAWLFPGMAGGGSHSEPASTRSAPQDETSPPPSSTPPSLSRPHFGRPPTDSMNTALCALITVMLADGAIRPGERAFVEGFADRAGLPRPAELRSWRPSELSQPERPAMVLSAMINLALIDRERDGSELQVIREFARQWGESLEQVDAHFKRAAERDDPPMIRLWRSLRRLLVVETELGDTSHPSLSRG